MVVDDEPLARRRLTAMVERGTMAEVVGEAGDAEEAAALISRLRPDVVLLDVQMPGRTGLELARGLGARPVVIFTTAHVEHAVDAFDAAAADYLLKPVVAEKLARAIDRASARLAGVPLMNEPRVTARALGTVRVFRASEIARFRAADKYTLFAIEGTEHVIDESLSALEGRLSAWGFLRVHRGELLQLARIRGVQGRGPDVEAELDDGQRVPVSRRRLPALRRRLRER